MSEKLYDKTERYNDALIFQASGDSDKIMELYNNNYGFLFNYARKYAGSNQYLEDFLQLGYEALVQAVNNYVNARERKYDFISFYRVWLNHYFFRFNCSMQNCVRIPENDFTKLRDNYVTLEFEEDEVSLQDCTDTEEIIFNNDLHQLLCQEMSRSLDTRSCYIMEEVYFNERSMASVGRDLGISRDAVRKRVLKAKEILKNNENMQIIARDYLGVGS